tara:strand:+ start:224 stop:397 length:174 start_codon:yes stop_codon:yes gene_type:complete
VWLSIAGYFESAVDPYDVHVIASRISAAVLASAPLNRAAVVTAASRPASHVALPTPA